MAFPYNPLEAGAIRLLHILPGSTSSDLRFTLTHHSFDDPATKYNALSYRWGDPTHVEVITLNGSSFGVAQNLFDCLKSFVENKHDKLDMTIGLWIDAICINQQDVAEKSVQVQQMWRVYTEATSVIAWLGLEVEYTAKAFAGLEEMGRQLETTGESFPGVAGNQNLTKYTNLPADELAAVNALTHNPYFTRTWIVQELICNKNVFLTSGKFCVLYMLLASLQVARGQGKDFSKPATFLLLQRYDTQYHALGMQPVPLSAATQLYSWMYSTQHHECFDRRDRIFALLSLPTFVKSGVSNHLKADYAMSVEEVFLATLAVWEKLYWKEVKGWNSPTYVRVPTAKTTRVVKDVQNTMAVVQKALGVDVGGDGFREWLESKRAGVYSTGNAQTLVTASGTSIDCSGLIIQDLLGARYFVKQIDLRQIAGEENLLSFVGGYLKTLAV